MSIELPREGSEVEVVVRGVVGRVSASEGWLFLRFPDDDGMTRNATVPVSAIVSVTEIVAEPTVNGSVVRDGEGRLWVRDSGTDDNGEPWWRLSPAPISDCWSAWADIPKPVTVRYDPARDES